MSQAIIHESSKIGADTQLGNFTIVEQNVHLGKNCRIGHHVVIHEGTIIGNNVRIDDHAVIGKLPMIAANSASPVAMSLKPASIADDCLIGTSAILYRGCLISEKVLVADLATVRERVTIGPHTIIGRGVAIEGHCNIGAFCKFETNAYLTAFSSVADHCFVAPCVATSNDKNIARHGSNNVEFKGVTMKTGARLGVGAVILPGVTITEESVVAAGALQTKDTEAKSIHAGIPAKKFRDVPEDQLLKNQRGSK